MIKGKVSNNTLASNQCPCPYPACNLSFRTDSVKGRLPEADSEPFY